MEVGELDLRNMGVPRWKTTPLDRTEWTSVVREAKAKLRDCRAKEEESFYMLFELIISWLGTVKKKTIFELH
jgi:hypothetical protein